MSDVKIKSMILDATAGNRAMWGKNKYPEGVIFMDKEPNLRIPPDVVATWDKIPFPDDFFNCVVFDPPHMIKLPHLGIDILIKFVKDEKTVMKFIMAGLIQKKIAFPK